MSVYDQIGLESIGQFCDFVLVGCCVHVDIPADVLFLQDGCGEIHLQSLVHHVTDVVVGTLVACRIRGFNEAEHICCLLVEVLDAST